MHYIWGSCLMSSASEKRREEIIELIHSQGKVKVTELSEKYSISEVSIRKDLEALEAQGQLSRIHGGAVGLNKLYLNMDLTERYKTNAARKKDIAELAAKFIDDNDTIMMNAGTTLTYVLRALRGKKNISIVTNSVQNATEAALYPDFNVILLGGEVAFLQDGNLFLVANAGRNDLHRVNITKDPLLEHNVDLSSTLTQSLSGLLCTAQKTGFAGINGRCHNAA